LFKKKKKRGQSKGVGHFASPLFFTSPACKLSLIRFKIKPYYNFNALQKIKV